MWSQIVVKNVFALESLHLDFVSQQYHKPGTSFLSLKKTGT